MGDGADAAVGAILAPSQMTAFSRSRENLQELRDRLGEVVTRVYCSVPNKSSLVKKKVPDDTVIVKDKILHQDGPLVGFYSILSEVDRPALFLRSDRPAPPQHLLQYLLEILRENEDLPAVYVMDPAEKIPFPTAIDPRVTRKLRGFIRTHDPHQVEFFLRTIQARNVSQ